MNYECHKCFKVIKKPVQYYFAWYNKWAFCSKACYEKMIDNKEYELQKNSIVGLDKQFEEYMKKNKERHNEKN